MPTDSQDAIVYWPMEFASQNVMNYRLMISVWSYLNTKACDLHGGLTVRLLDHLQGDALAEWREVSLDTFKQANLHRQGIMGIMGLS